MSIKSPFIPDEDISHAVPAGQAVVTVIAYSLGLVQKDVADLIGIPGLIPAHPLMGRDPIGGAALSHLQPVLNELAFDGQCLIRDGKPGKIDRYGVEPTAMTLARAVIIDAVRNPVLASIQSLLKTASSMLEDVIQSWDHDMTVEAIGLQLPGGLSSAIEDPGTVQSLVARMCGVRKSDLVDIGIGKSHAKYMLNGREDWPEDRLDYLAERVLETARKIAAAELLHYDDDEDLPLHSIRAIRSLSQAETATLWALFPIHRPLVERYSPHIYSSDRTVGRRNYADAHTGDES